MARTLPTSLHDARPTEKLALLVALGALAASTLLWSVSAEQNVSLDGTVRAAAAASPVDGPVGARSALVTVPDEPVATAASSSPIAPRGPGRNGTRHRVAARRAEARAQSASERAARARTELPMRAPVRLAAPRTRATMGTTRTRRPATTAPGADRVVALLATGSRGAATTVPASAAAPPRIVPQAEVRAAFRALSVEVAGCPQAASDPAVVSVSLDGEQGTARRTSTLDVVDAATLRCIDAAIARMTVPTFSGSPLVVRYRLPIVN